MYEALKTAHILGVVVLIGNVTITAFWKVFSDLTRDSKIVAHAQHGVTVTDWIFTLSGIALILIGGYGAAYIQGLPIFTTRWLVLGQVLFAVSGCIWIGVLVPIQIRQAKLARVFANSGEIPPAYQAMTRSWLIWGILATIPLIAAIFVMIDKA